jgi:hypothetical protein
MYMFSDIDLHVLSMVNKRFNAKKIEIVPKRKDLGIFRIAMEPKLASFVPVRVFPENLVVRTNR